MTHAKQGGWGCGCGSRFNNREEISYYGCKGAQLRDVNDDNIWDVGPSEGVGHTSEVQGMAELVTKRFNYCEVFRNHFNYRHQVEDKTIDDIILFQLRGIGLQSIGLTGVMPIYWH